jgi:hypothetical protein
MDPMKLTQLFLNFVQHPRTTIAGLISGTASGATILAGASMISLQAGYDFSHVNWVDVAKVLGLSTTIGTVVGGFMRDGSKAEPPSQTQGPAVS